MSGQYGRYIVFHPDSQPDELLHRHHTGRGQQICLPDAGLCPPHGEAQ